MGLKSVAIARVASNDCAFQAEHCGDEGESQDTELALG